MAARLTDGIAVHVHESSTANEFDKRSYEEQLMEQELGWTPKQSFPRWFRTPTLSHASSVEEHSSPEPHFGQPAFRYQRSHDDLYGIPSQIEVNKYTTQVRLKLQEACNSASQGEGLVVIFVSAMGIQGITTLIPSIDNSRTLICEAYEHQHHTTCTFINPCKAEVFAVYQEIAQGNYMDQFKFFLSHYIGHGLNDHICLRDGYLSTVDLRNMLSASNAPHLKNKIRGLNFDCCRVNAVVRKVKKPDPEENLFVYFAVPYGHKTYVFNGGGASISTIEFVKLMKGKRTYTIRELFVKHYDAVQRAVSRLDHHIDCGSGFTSELTSDLVIVRGTAKKVKRKRICAAVTSLVLAAGIMLCLLYFLYFYYPHSISLLAKIGDAIDCGSFIHPLWRYSAVEYQLNCKDQNDCKDIFTMTATSIDKSETKKYSQFYHGLIDRDIAAHENTSITKHLYETYPVYIWGGTINLTVQTSEYTDPPRLFRAYIICDQHNFQNFQDGNKPFHYVHMFNLDKDYTIIPNIKVHQNCYIYVGIRIYANSAINVSATFDIDYFYLNMSNPNFDPGFTLNKDSKVRYPVDRSGDRVIVCKSEKTDHPLSTHIDLTFDELHSTILPPIFCLIIILFIIFCVSNAVLIHSFCPCKPRHNGYQELKPQT